MRKLLGLIGLLALFITPLLAQDTQAPPGEQAPTAPTAPAAPTEPVKVKHTYPVSKMEISGGYSYRSYYGPTGSIGMNGGFATFDYNVFRWLAAEGGFAGVVGSFHIPGEPPDSLTVLTFMGGARINPLGHHRLTPFGHALFGVGINTTGYPEFSDYPASTSAVAVQAWEAGGGLDFSLTPRWGIRMIEYDYGVAKFLGNGVPNQSSHRLSFGIVYHFGKR
jgi:Outer membrane protein beta-barrel domain